VPKCEIKRNIKVINDELSNQSGSDEVKPSLVAVSEIAALLRPSDVNRGNKRDEMKVGVRRALALEEIIR
jgi:hypothetical protein